MSGQRFVLVDRALYDELGGDYFGDSSYATYNYLGGGLSGLIKRRHFEAALRFVDEHDLGPRAVDVGCADGVFLPSLDRRFDQVLGIDIRAQFIAVAQHIVDRLHLGNTTVACTENLDRAAVLGLTGGDNDVVFLLETLEHIGRRDDFYGSKIDFLTMVADMLRPGGRIVVSVPNMVGISLLVQQVGLRAAGRYVERLSLSELARGVVLRDVASMEARWDNDDHLGFNHRLLERRFDEIGQVEVRRNLGFSVFYVIRTGR